MKRTRILFAALAITAAGYAQTAPLPDFDRDGVPDSQDGCPNTPPGAAPVTPGCSALDIVENPGGITKPVVRDMKKLAAIIDARRDLTPAVTDLNRAGQLFEQSAGQIGAGDVCGGVNRFESGLASLDAARLALQTAIATPEPRQALVGGKYGDTTEADMKRLNLKMYKADLDRLSSESAIGRRVFDNVCKSSVRRRGSPATITRIDDGNRRIELDGRQVIGMATAFEARADLYPGRRILVDGLHFIDNTSLAIFVEAVDSPGIGGGVFFNCLHFRFTPAQRSLPDWNGPFRKHEIEAYDRGGAYKLEQGMGIAAESIGCPPISISGYQRYSLRVGIRYVSTISGFWVNATLAPDLDQYDRPVQLPMDIHDNYPAFITVTSRVQKVGNLLSNPPTPGSPGFYTTGPQVLMEREYITRVYPRNFFCTALYEKTIFTLEDKDQVNFRQGKVKDVVALFAATDPGTSLSFQAEGYKVQPPAASTYPDRALILQGYSFAVFNFDFHQPDMLHGWERWGVDKPSGLAWPKITGLLNGRQFSFSCALPGIIRDAVSECGDTSYSFYRLPFHKNSPGWSVGQGNNGNLTHMGQAAFAFDFGTVVNSPAILAARGGVVRFVDESQSLNCPIGAGCDANTVVVSHPDGDESAYFHMPQNGVHVAVGQRVYRGDQLGLVGNTGQSTGPHVHFQVQPDQVKFPGAQSIPILFQSTWPNSVLQRDCYVPQTGDLLVSNNPL